MHRQNHEDTVLTVIRKDQKGAKVQSPPFEEGVKVFRTNSSLRPEVNFVKFGRCSEFREFGDTSSETVTASCPATFPSRLLHLRI